LFNVRRTVLQLYCCLMSGEQYFSYIVV